MNFEEKNSINLFIDKRKSHAKTMATGMKGLKRGAGFEWIEI